MLRILTLLLALAAALPLCACSSSVFNSDPGPRTYVVSETCRPVSCCPTRTGPPEGPIR